jgi:hypothetical protein
MKYDIIEIEAVYLFFREGIPQKAFKPNNVA